MGTRRPASSSTTASPSRPCDDRLGERGLRRDAVVIGEGESATKRRCSIVGEELGAARGEEGSSLQVDIAVDPLEGHEPLRHRARRARSRCLPRPREEWSSPRARHLHGEDRGGTDRARPAFDLDAPVAENLRSIAKAFGKGGHRSDHRGARARAPPATDRTTSVCRRSARIRLISDGDLSRRHRSPRRYAAPASMP